MHQQENYISNVQRLLKQYYGISLADIGLDKNEWLDRFGDQPAVEAVEAYATKYDLTPLASAAFTPSSK